MNMPCNTSLTELGDEMYNCNYYKNININYDAIMKNKIDIIKKYYDFEHNFKILIYFIYNNILGEEFSKIPYKYIDINRDKSYVRLLCYNTYNSDVIMKYDNILRKKLDELFLLHTTETSIKVGGNYIYKKYIKYKIKNIKQKI